MTINLKVPDLRELKPRITVFGVGGAGGNAVNNMIESGLQGVEFVVANTDSQALMSSSVERRIQMGVDLTEGLGAGSHPEVGRSAAEEACDEIKDQLAGSHMVFITAGMGGGTGTGAAPVVARTAREQGILTVGVVTKPFQFEGQRRMRIAEIGIHEMQKFVDTLIVIPNQNLFRVANEKTTFADAFAMADEVLYSGVACITDLIVKEGLINLDFADVRAVMSEMGKAMMGTGEASGEKRATEAAEAAIANPLLDDVSMRGARGLLISITGGNDLTLYEVDEAASRIRDQVDSDANVILGATFDETLEGTMRVSVVATGIDSEEMRQSESETNVVSMPDAVRSLLQAARPDDSRVAEASTHSAPAAEQPVERTTEDGVTIRPLAVEPAAYQEAAYEEGEGATAQAEEPAPATPYVPPAAERPERHAPPRMPRIDEFPAPAQTQMAAASGAAPEVGLDAHKKKSGFLDRLKGMGISGRDGDTAEAQAPARHEPQMGSARPDAPHPQAANPQAAEPPVVPVPTQAQPVVQQPAAQQPTAPQPAVQHPVAPAPAGSESGIRTERIAGREDGFAEPEDEQLEIPAFLRRQAN